MPRQLSVEHKRKMQEGRVLAKQLKSTTTTITTTNIIIPIITNKKPECIITGKELNAFDFFTPLRNSLRPVHKYLILRKLLKEITNINVWNDVSMVGDILRNHVTLIILE